MMNGIKKLSAFVLKGRFTIEEGIICAGKVACLVAFLLTEQEELIKFDQNIDMRSWTIESPSPTKLNKLKKTNPEAFFYFVKAYELLRKDE